MSFDINDLKIAIKCVYMTINMMKDENYPAVYDDSDIKKLEKAFLSLSNLKNKLEGNPNEIHS